MAEPGRHAHGISRESPVRSRHIFWGAYRATGGGAACRWLRPDDVTLFQLTCESNPGMIFHLKSSVHQKSGRFIHINRKKAPRRPLNYEGPRRKILARAYIQSVYLASASLFSLWTFIFMRLFFLIREVKVTRDVKVIQIIGIILDICRS